MKKLNNNELINVNGGLRITGAILQYGRLALQSIYNVGVGLGSAIRRLTAKSYCPIN